MHTKGGQSRQPLKQCNGEDRMSAAQPSRWHLSSGSFRSNPVEHVL